MSVTNSLNVVSLPALDFSFFSTIDPVQFTLSVLFFLFCSVLVVEASLFLIFETIKFAETVFNNVDTKGNLFERILRK